MTANRTKPRLKLQIASTLLVCGAMALSAGCEKKKKKSSASPKTEEVPDITEEPGAQATPTPVAEEPTGNTPANVSTESFTPFSNVTELSGNNMTQMMREVAELIYGFNVTFSSFSHESFQLSPVENKATQCSNDSLQRLRFVLQGDRYTLVEDNPDLAKQCIGEMSSLTQNFYRSELRYDSSFECGDVNFNINGVPLTDPTISKGFCELGTSGQFLYYGNFFAQESSDTDHNNQLRFMARTRAIADRAGGRCSWTWDATQNVKVFNDCAFLDRTDTPNDTSTRFVVAFFDRVVGHNSLNGGFVYTGGVVNVQYNNWKGTITFNGTAAPSWTMTSTGGQQLSGQLEVPQGHGVLPTTFPSGGTGTGGTTEAFVPVGGAGTNEVRCASNVTAANIVQGNGMVPLFSYPAGATPIYYTGYVHESAQAPRRAFTARIENGQLIWCRTYMSQESGSSQGVNLAMVGNDLFVVLQADQNVFPTVGSPVVASHPAPGRPVVYIARISSASGNVQNSTWYDLNQDGGGSFAAVLLDGEGVATDELRLRASLTGARGPGCTNVGSGAYAAVLKKTLNTTVGGQPLSCP